VLPNVVVTCTSRKTADVPRLAQMRHVRNKVLGGRIREWMDHLDRCEGEPKQAGALYCGSAWVPVARLIASKRARIWIISAGHGLITPETEICAYAATFSPNHPDSVVRNGSKAFQTADWWRGLSAQASGKKFRRLSDIAKAFPEVPIVAALSSDYLAAVEADLTAARDHLRNPDSMIVISSGAAKTGALEANFLPCDSRMENLVGRGRSALNVRLLEALLDEHEGDLRASRVRRKYSQLLARLPAAGYPKRERSEDDDVRTFIRAVMKGDASASHTGLLRQYRKSGRACEQSRFRGLFRQVKAELERKGA
jgi:hypothetical protein